MALAYPQHCCCMQEEDQLRRLVAEHGEGKWKKMHKSLQADDPLKRRTNVRLTRVSHTRVCCIQVLCKWFSMVTTRKQ